MSPISKAALEAARERERVAAQIAKLTFEIDDPDEFTWYESSEEGKVHFIKKYLRTKEQRQWLYEHDLSIEDVLNGRTPMEHLDHLTNVIFTDWNQKMGEQAFGF